jgi:signal transduction histidine kinase
VQVLVVAGQELLAHFGAQQAVELVATFGHFPLPALPPPGRQGFFGAPGTSGALLIESPVCAATGHRVAESDLGAPEAYREILKEYLLTHSEAALYHVSILSRDLVGGGLGPEDIVALHCEALEQALEGLSYREQARGMSDAQQFLLEVMIAYGVQYKEYLELRLQEAQREAATREARERQRALDAERVGRQKGEILTIIAHELRTPLAAAQGNLDYARRSLSRGQIERVPVLLTRAREAIDRLSRLSADLVQAGRGEFPELQLTERALGPIIIQSCAWAHATALDKKIELDFEIGPVDPQILGDENGLLSLFGNLLSNAIRYTPAGGRITVRHGERDGWAWVEIRDTGVGMAPEVQARIFEKFYRAADARQLESQGLGLGLSLVKQMVDAHAGRIEVESASGRGSIFRVSLPLANAHVEVHGDD